MRKITASAVMVLGVVVLALAVAVLIWHRFSLPALAEQTESQWAAYRLHRWALLVTELPLALDILLCGYLLWPGRLGSGSLTRTLAVIGVLLGLAGLGSAGFVIYNAIQYREPFAQAPWLAVEGGTLLAGLAALAALAVHRLRRRTPAVQEGTLGEE